MENLNFNCPFCTYRRLQNDVEHCKVLNKNIADVSKPNSCDYFSQNYSAAKKRKAKILRAVILLVSVVVSTAIIVLAVVKIF